jgi:hypothetical protein
MTCTASERGKFWTRIPIEWHDVMALDESWFDCSTDHESIWLPPGEKAPERLRLIFQSQKWMVTIVGNPRGFYLIRVLPNGCKFKSSYHRRETLGPLSRQRREQACGAGRQLIVHADNARPHTHSGSITRIHGGERTRKSHSPTVLAGFGTL